MAQNLIMALPKGRLLPEAVKLLKSVGVDAQGVLLSENARKLVFPPKDCGAGFSIGFLIIRPVDVAAYVYHGAADLGIVGNDSLRDQQWALYEPLDLRLGQCRLVLAGTPEMKERFLKMSRGVSEDLAGLRLATKYPYLASGWAQKEGIDVSIVSLHGSIELAPLTGLADLILDLVSSGETLKQNGLVEIQTVLDVSARLVVNRASLKTSVVLEPFIQKMYASLRKSA